MNKKITKTIEQKVFSKNDLFRFLDFLYEEYSKSKSEHKSFKVILKCEENESYEFENKKIKEDENIFDIKRVLHLSIYFIDFRNNKKIYIDLSQGNSNWNNSYSIESSNGDWVDSKNQRLKDILDSVKPQNSLFKNFKRIFFHLLSLNLGFLFLRILDFLLSKFNYESTGADLSNPFIFLLDKVSNLFPFFHYILYLLIAWAFGMWILILFWFNLEKYLEELWPSIEFDFGPEHKKYSKNRRKTIWIIVSLIFIPLFLQLIFLL